MLHSAPIVPSLNSDQQKAVAGIFQFLFSDDKEFIVSGPAGTGKTFLMNHIMKTVIQEYTNASKLLGQTPIDYEVALTATTNKAVEVLSVATGFPATTVHSFMNLKVVDNYTTGVSSITRTNSWKVHKNQLIFVDEASMIDTKLHDFILLGTDSSCKIIYLGDHCQMAPVFETISPVYKHPKNFVNLTEPMRNAGQPALVDLCARLRNTVETGKFFQLPSVPGVIDYLDGPSAQQFIDTTFKVENPGCRMLCYTNARVQEYNDYVRNLRGYPDLFTEGEVLINNSGIQLGKTFLRVEQELTVNKVLSTPAPHSLDATDPNATIDVYRVELSTPGGSPISVMIPSNTDHYKAMMKHFARIKDWTKFYFLKNNFPDLRQKDAATVYKAQGSTYKSVFLDLGNIGKCTKEDQLARMLYVGASRATTRLFLFGQLPDRLF